MKFCDACGACMTHPTTNVDVIGLRVTIEGGWDPQPCISRHKAPATYNVCFSCLLEAVGVKPNLDPGIDVLLKDEP